MTEEKNILLAEIVRRSKERDQLINEIYELKIRIVELSCKLAEIELKK
jgi:hypothetical protein